MPLIATMSTMLTKPNGDRTGTSREFLHLFMNLSFYQGWLVEPATGKSVEAFAHDLA